MAGVIIGLIVFFVLLLVALRPVRIVAQYERLVILALGKYAGTRGPGLTIVIPGFEKAIKVDIRERFFDIPSQTAITKDNAPIAIDFLVYYKVVNPHLSVVEVGDAVNSSVQIATTTLRAVIGDIPLDDVLAQRERINDILRVKLDEVTERWGLKVTTVELKEIQPPREVQDAMNRQMTAERERRATVTTASGQRESEIMVAEGEKQAAILRAEGEKQSAILSAEGEQQAQLLRAQGFATALKAIYGEASKIDEKTMALQYLDMLRKVGASPATKFVLPMELTGLMQQMIGTMNDNSTKTGESKGRIADGSSGD